MPDSEWGMISVKRVPMPFDTFREEYYWNGKGYKTRISSAFVEDSPDVILSSRRLKIGPFSLRVLEFDPSTMSYLCVRDSLPGRFAEVKYHARYLSQNIYYRLILTAYVWGLAQRSEGTLPSWKDIYILRKLFRVGSLR